MKPTLQETRLELRVAAASDLRRMEAAARQAQVPNRAELLDQLRPKVATVGLPAAAAQVSGGMLRARVAAPERLEEVAPATPVSMTPVSMMRARMQAAKRQQASSARPSTSSSAANASTCPTHKSGPSWLKPT